MNDWKHIDVHSEFIKILSFGVVRIISVGINICIFSFIEYSSAVDQNEKYFAFFFKVWLTISCHVTKLINFFHRLYILEFILDILFLALNIIN